MKKRNRKISPYERTPAARRRKRSKKKYTLYYILFAILAVVVVITLSLTVFFKTEVISVQGQSRYANEDLIAATGVALGDNLIRLSPSRIEENLKAKFPYVHDAAVRRVFPATLKIEVTQAEAVAAIENDAALTTLLDDRGRVLESDMPIPAEGFARVMGFNLALKPGDYLPEEQRDAYQLLLALQQSLADNHLVVDVINFSDPISVWLLFEGRVSVFLGGPSDLEYKVKFARAALDSSVEANFIGVLDVSVRPNARIRPQNIYMLENWKFYSHMMEDYERSR